MILNVQDFNFEEMNFMGIEDTEVTETKDFKCQFPLCDKAFRFKSEYKRHIAIHESQRPFQCDHPDCNKGFKRLDALTTHMRVHTGEKPYICPVGSCQLPFSTKAGLRYHILKHKNDKMFKCDFPGCGQSFLTLTQLNQHKKRIKVHDTLLSHSLRINHSNSREKSAEEKEPVKSKSIANEPSPYEPPISKHQQQEPIFGQLTEINNVSTPNDCERQETNWTMQQPLNNLKQLELQSQNLLKTVNPLETNYAEANFNPMIYPVAFNQDQATLLKRINNILDENMLLKQHLQIYQKMIEVCQITINGNPLISVINSLKNSNNSALKNLS
mmetsp:Transcript_36707/g.42898  ORF Transcript_36707/g.42898 Transcript_36707/m.42898 type:complete len:328 (-) Transcript_36707:279-1262(-)